MKSVWAGVDIGGTKTAVVIADNPPAVLHRIEFPTLPAEGPQRAIDLIVRGIHDSLAAVGVDREALRAIGVSCGGPLTSATGVIQAPPNLSTWVDVPITNILGSEFDVPCGLENDANAGAVAEHRFGAGRGTRHMVFLTMGTGLGAGIIADGKLYRGACDAAGEIGHVRLTRGGPVGYHKAGSVEGWASGGGLGRIATRIMGEGRELSARDVAEAARSGDARARKLIRDTGRRLGETLAILVDILNPERIVIGGLAMRLGDDLLKPARAVLKREALEASAAVCEIVPAELNERIGDVAALCIALETGAAPSPELSEALRVFAALPLLDPALDAAAERCSAALRGNRKLLICGNGGSAAEAQHLAGELMGRYKKNRPALPAIALTADSALVTCIGNDYCFDDVFARQLQALGQPGDVLIVFTTSGTSPNVVQALAAAREIGVQSIAFLGRDGGNAKDLADCVLLVPHPDTARTQEAHQFLMHRLMDRIEQALGHAN